MTNSSADWWDNPASLPYHDALTQGAAASNGAITPQGLANVIGQESGFNPNAVSSTSSATGIGQILSSTAQQPGYGISPVDPSDPNASIIFAGQYIGKTGVSGYSGGSYTAQQVNAQAGTTVAAGTVDTSGYPAGSFTSGQGAVMGAGATNGAGTLDTTTPVTGADGSSNVTTPLGAAASLVPTTLTQLIANIGEYGTRITVVVLGVVFIGGGLLLFKPVQSVVSSGAKLAA